MRINFVENLVPLPACTFFHLKSYDHTNVKAFPKTFPIEIKPRIICLAKENKKGKKGESERSRILLSVHA